jgi:hypothetical protein
MEIERNPLPELAEGEEAQFGQAIVVVMNAEVLGVVSREQEGFRTPVPGHISLRGQEPLGSNLRILSIDPLIVGGILEIKAQLAGQSGGEILAVAILDLPAMGII